MGKTKSANLKISAKQPSRKKCVLRRCTPITFSALSSSAKRFLLWQTNKIYGKPIEGMSVRSFFLLHRNFLCSKKYSIQEAHAKAAADAAGCDASATLFYKKCRGSMTVEAALVLPLFLFFLLNLLWIIEIFSLHSTLLASLREVGRELSTYAYAYDSMVQEEEDSGLEALVENAAFSYLYVKNRVEALAGSEYLDNSPLTNGRDSLVYIESSILQEGDILDLVVTYKVSPLIDIIGFSPGRFYNRYYGRAWTGYEVGGNTDTEAGGIEYVYVAENATVYHLSKDCTHIALKISECDAMEVEKLRNDYGAKYYPCELCGKRGIDGVGTFYIAANGDRYHRYLQCSGLKRTVTVMLREEAEKLYRVCTRCQQEYEK